MSALTNMRPFAPVKANRTVCMNWRSGSATVDNRSSSSRQRSALPSNWKQELEALRSGSGSNGAASYSPPAPAPAAPRSSSPSKRPASAQRTSLPANWKQELDALRGSSAPAAPAYEAPARSTSPSKRPASAQRTSLPANWKQELDALRGSSSFASSDAPATARSSSASWRDAPADTSSSARASSTKRTVSAQRTSLPSNWKQELEAMRGGSSSSASAAPSSSSSWRDAPTPASSVSPSRGAKKPTAPVKKTVVPSNWRDNL